MATAKDFTKAQLEALIQEAIVDAYDEHEQRVGFLCVIQDNVKVPFSTVVLGIKVEVTGFDDADGGEIVALCKRGASRQQIPVTDLPLPKELPEGGEWILAYREWARFQ